MIQLYGGNKTRAVIVQWYLEELGLPYDYIPLDLQMGDHRKPEFLAINPMGKVPALKDGDCIIWESGAILLYLADKYAKNRLVQKVGRSRHNGYSSPMLPSLWGSSSTIAGRPNYRNSYPHRSHLAGQPFLCEGTLTVADIAVASYLNYGRQLMSLDFSAYPAIMGYLERIGKREAFGKAFLGRQI